MCNRRTGLGCDVCKDGFELSLEFNTCLEKCDECKTPTNCTKHCNCKGICEQCDEGYYQKFLGDEVLCELIIPPPANCATANRTGKCFFCEEGFIIDNGLNSCEDKTAYEGCLQLYNGECKFCDSENLYELVDGVCNLKLPCTVDNCYTDTCNGGVCEKCHRGFTMNKSDVENNLCEFLCTVEDCLYCPETE